jgi:protein-tyrosine phosphatase
MSSRLYWVEGGWPGKLALAARPRGGDWLEAEITSWQGAGINTVLSLLTAEEERDLNLINEKHEVKKGGMKFLSLPIQDREVPSSESEVRATVETIGVDLNAGKNVVIHCRQGVGRSGLLAACLLTTNGFSPGAAVEVLSSARGAGIPETKEQRAWIDQYAANLTSAK